MQGMNYMNHFLETVLVVVWLVGSFVQPAISFSAGVVIFYIIQIEREVKTLSIWYFFTLVVVSIVGGYYVSQVTPLLLPNEYISIVSAVNFGLGLVSKIVLDIVLTVDFMKKILVGRKK